MSRETGFNMTARVWRRGDDSPGVTRMSRGSFKLSVCVCD